MTADLMLTLEKAMQAWQPPEIPEDIPQGDTPGDKNMDWTAAERKSRKDFSGSFTYAARSSGKITGKTSGYYGVWWIRRGKNGYSSLLTLLF